MNMLYLLYNENGLNFSSLNQISMQKKSFSIEFGMSDFELMKRVWWRTNGYNNGKKKELIFCIMHTIIINLCVFVKTTEQESLATSIWCARAMQCIFMLLLLRWLEANNCEYDRNFAMDNKTLIHIRTDYERNLL